MVDLLIAAKKLKATITSFCMGGKLWYISLQCNIVIQFLKWPIKPKEYLRWEYVGWKVKCTLLGKRNYFARLYDWNYMASGKRQNLLRKKEKKSVVARGWVKGRGWQWIFKVLKSFYMRTMRFKLKSISKCAAVKIHRTLSNSKLYKLWKIDLEDQGITKWDADCDKKIKPYL